MLNAAPKAVTPRVAPAKALAFVDASVLFAAAWRDTSPLRRLWSLPTVQLMSSSLAVYEAKFNLALNDQQRRLSELVSGLMTVQTIPLNPIPSVQPSCLGDAPSTPAMRASVADYRWQWIVWACRTYPVRYVLSVDSRLIACSQAEALRLASVPQVAQQPPRPVCVNPRELLGLLANKAVDDWEQYQQRLQPSVIIPAAMPTASDLSSREHQASASLAQRLASQHTTL